MNTCGGWEAVRQSVRQRIGARAFDAWFGSLEGEIEGATLSIRCPDRFSRDWIRGRYADVLVEAAQPLAIEYRVGPHKPAEGSRPPARGPARAVAPAPRAEPGFESFVAGPANALALEAARAVARGETGRCNPLVITGGAGVGKTHLCEAIRALADGSVVYRSSEEFTSEVTQAIRSDRMSTIRQRYRRAANLLILEDLQFLPGKRATQIELFHTLDHLLSRGRAVVLTADRPPGEIDGLDRQLASRAASGLVARIGPPEQDTRRAILRAKAAAGGVRLPVPCLELLAERAVESVRDLLAGLNQVVARATLLKQSITVDLVRESLATVDVPGRRHSLEEIIGLVARAYSVSVDELHGRSRKRSVSRPRQLAMYLCRRYTDASLKEIGRSLHRDHASVLYAIDAVERRALEQPQLRYQLETLAARLGR